jgi:hypothetical protein
MKLSPPTKGDDGGSDQSRGRHCYHAPRNGRRRGTCTTCTWGRRYHGTSTSGCGAPKRPTPPPPRGTPLQDTCAWPSAAGAADVVALPAVHVHVQVVAGGRGGAWVGDGQVGAAGVRIPPGEEDKMDGGAAECTATRGGSSRRPWRSAEATESVRLSRSVSM